MTPAKRLLYREDAYQREAPGLVVDHTPEGGVIVEPPLFFPSGGGQPGDSGWLEWGGKSCPIATSITAPDRQSSILVPGEAAPLPPLGAHVVQVLDWRRRYLHMRMHTALHLLSVVIPLPISGGQIGAGSGWLDFRMPVPSSNHEVIEEALNMLIDRDLEVSEGTISQAELAARPEFGENHVCRSTTRC